MPNWKKVITSGSNAVLNEITSSGGIDSPDITIDGWGSISGSLSSLESDITGISGGVITPIQLYADCKSLTSGNVPWNVLSDLQPAVNQGYAVWIAPADGHLYESDISPEQTNTSTSDVLADLIINGTPTSQKQITMGAAGSAVNTSWGVGTYAFTKGDRLSFYFNKQSNTSDLYAIQLTFRLKN